MFPEYVNDPGVAFCLEKPTTLSAARGEQGSLIPELAFDDHSYFYTGYAITDDDSVAQFAAAYRDAAQQGTFLTGDVDTPDGAGTWDSDTLYQLRESLPNQLGNLGQEPLFIASQIPVMIERPHSHLRSGHAYANVLYLDGYVETLRYPGPWPMTETTINTLLQLDTMDDEARAGVPDFNDDHDGMGKEAPAKCCASRAV